MKTLGSPRPWPPEVCDELRQHLSRYSSFKRDVPVIDDLFGLVEELDGWLADDRPYNMPRKDEWTSLVEDVNAAFDLIGSSLIALLPSAASLLKGLHPGLGPLQNDRAALRVVLEQVRAELRDQAAPGAAFADLVAAVTDPDTRTNLIEGRVDLIDAVLHFTDRPLRHVVARLSGILNNDATYVDEALHLLDCRDLPEGFKVDEDAGLTELERIDLAVRLVGYTPPARHNVVWVFYGNARIDGWRVDVGSCHFFSGPTLLEFFGRINELVASDGGHALALREFSNLPAELIGDETNGKFVRGDHKWPSEDHWVAVRVDLGMASLYDMVETALEQVRALLALAVFDVGRTSWVELTGYRHFADGAEGGSSMPFKEVGFENRWVDADHTHSWLYEQRTELAAHVAANPDMLKLPDVQAVVTATSVFAAMATASPALTLLESVRVIETQASVLRIHWKDLVDQYATPGNAIRRAQLGAAQAIETVAYDDELRTQLPHLYELPNDFNVYRGGQRMVDMSIAHDKMPQVVGQLPTYNRGCRKLRHAVDELATPASIAEFVRRERDVDQRLLRRVHRVRNSLTHGGPSHANIIRTSSEFVTGRAKDVTGINVRSLLVGEPLTATLQRHSVEMANWIAGIANAAGTTEALFPGKVKVTT